MKREILGLVFLSSIGQLVALPQDPTTSYAKLDDSSVVIRINNKNWTKNDIEQDLMVNIQLMHNKNRRRKLSKSDAMFMERFRNSSFERYIAETVLENYATAHAIVPTDDVQKKVRRFFVKKFGARGHKLQDLKYMLSTNAPRLEAMMRTHALRISIDEALSQGIGDKVSAQMISNRIEFVKKCNQIAAATNAAVFARATNVWNLVKSGEDFESLAKRYSQDRYISEGSEWGTFELTHLASEPEVMMALSKAKPGDVLPPLESDGGLSILRRDTTNFVNDAGQESCTLSRIFFELPYFYEVPSPEAAEKQCRDLEKQRRWSEMFEETRNKLKIEYPVGTNIFMSVENDKH